MLVDAALPVVPEVQWLDPQHWTNGQDTIAGGRGAARYVHTPVGEAVLRHYRRGGLVAHLSRDRYIWLGAARTRAFREFRLLAALTNAGLPVPAPIAAGYRRGGGVYRADILTKRVESSRTLAEILQADSADPVLAESIGRTIARFHAAGVHHADLNAHNILVDPTGDTWLIDFDRGELRKPALAWQQATLARLHRSLRKLGADRRQANTGGKSFNQQFWHPLLASYHAALADPAIAVEIVR